MEGLSGIQIDVLEFERFFSTNLDMFCIADFRGTFIKLSKSWQNVLGYKIEELEGSAFLKYVHPDDVNDTLNIISNLSEQQIIMNFVNRYKCKDGTYKYIEWKAEPYGDLIYATAREITDKVEKQNELEEQKENFKMYLETVDDLVYVATMQGIIIHCNKAVTNKLGYSIEELTHMQMFDLYPEKYRIEVEGIFEDIFKGDTDYCSLPVNKKDGSFLPTETKVWFGQWNGTKCIYGISKDLSEQHSVIEKFHKLFNNNLAIMYVCSIPDGKIIDANTAFLEKLDYEKKEIIGKTTSEIGLFLENNQCKAIEEILEKHTKIQNFEVKFKKKNGQIIIGLFSCEIINNQFEKSFLAVITDITEMKKSELELLRAKDLAESANVMKSQFLANMSHEIRTPMNGILGFLDLLQRSTLSKEQKDYILEAKSASEMLLYLLNDILDFSKIEAGKLEVENTSFKLRATVENAVSVFVSKAEEKHIELYTSIKSSVPDEVIGDPARLRQILHNLISNAIKFTEKGEIKVSVDCKEDSDGKVLLIFEVKDTGMGISKENLNELFKPFVQADASTTRKFGGTGLGLAICKELVKLMHGDISVESQIKKGSTFKFTVQFGVSQEVKSLNKFEETRGINVLVVDDNKYSRKIVHGYLESAGCKVFEAESADKAITSILMNYNNDKKIDIAIVDFQMQGMNGYQLAKTLNTIPYAKDVKLILLTSAAQKGDAYIAQRYGYSGYLSKPILRDELINCVSIVQGLEKKDDATDTQIITRYTAKELQEHLQPRILLVEDNEINRKLVISMLKQDNLTCDIAVDGSEAVKALSKKDYDIVFMDCQMPVMDGYQSTAKIREMEGEKKHTPIVAMTANAMEGDRLKCLNAGMDDYISKPVNFKIMFSMIESKCKYKMSNSNFKDNNE